MNKTIVLLSALAIIALTGGAASRAETVSSGKGSYTTVPPKGMNLPPRRI